MQTNPAPESGLFTPRILLAFVLSSAAVFLAVLSFAANPPTGTITPASAPLTWQGTATSVPPSAGDDTVCEEGVNCDTFQLTISGTPADWTGKLVRVRIQWLLNTSDYDLVVRKGSIDGPEVGSSGGFANTAEQVALNPASSSIGTGVFFVRAVYFATTPADQYNGVAEVVAGGSPPIPAPTPATGVAPRYQIHTPPAAGAATLGIDAAEPSIGVNWLSETGQNGGRSMYIALLQTLRVTFTDSCPSSPSALWENVSFVTTTAQTFDPILFTDRTTGRTLVSQLIFPAGSAFSASGYTDNDGDLWVPSTGAGPGSGVDHQTIGGGGPFAAPIPPGAIYPNAIYYCAQLPTATCALSINGGLTYGPAVPVDAGAECGGLHGHIKVGPTGVAYLPNKGCGTGQGVIVSEDNGVTWDVRLVPGSIASESDPAVGIGRGDETGGVGRLYLGYADGDTKAVVATSDDRGLTWSQPMDVGAQFGINNVAFPAMVAGDDDRAAIAFYGTPTAGGIQGAKFTGVFHLYIAHTYDGGQTWRTVNVTPNDPMQRGCIWLGGGSNICRNMLDFMGADIDKRGRVLVGYNDGCAGAECSQASTNATGNSYTALAAIARQVGGKSLFAAQDALFPDTPTVPGAPYVTALRNNGIVRLAWSLSNNGGSPVTQYTISRGTSSGGESFLANVPGTQLSYIDTTATNTGLTYFYKVAAANAQGTSCGNNEVAARFFGSSNSAAGYKIATDPTGDQKAAPADPDLDVQTLSISEPATGLHAGKLVFLLKMQTAPSAGAPGANRKWRIIWDSPNSAVGQFYVGMVTDDAGEESFDYGTVKTGVVGLVLGVPETQFVGAPDFGSLDANGLITIAIAKEKVGVAKTGDLMGNFSVRTYKTPEGNFVRTTDAIDLTSNADANDFTGNAFTYAVVGPIPGLNSVVSRKTHTGVGTFDVDLPLAGSPGIECRNTGDNTHRVVFRFTHPAVIGGVSVTPAAGKTAFVSSAITSGNELTVNLNTVSNAQTLTINLTGVNVPGAPNAFSVPMGVLLGDINSTRVVTGSDVNLTKAQQSKPVTGANFRTDVNASGVITGSDVNLIKAKQSTFLP